MAVDPATIKVIITTVTTAIKKVTDPESRQKMMFILIGGLAGLVVIILIPIYLLTHPFEMLKVIFADDPEIANIEEFKTEHDNDMLIFDASLLWNEGADYPMPLNGTVTSEYGERDNPFGSGAAEFHGGIDIQGARHANIVSVADGVIEKINTAESTSGNTILIKHTKADGTVFYSFYAHLSQIYMFEGQSIKQGAVIGLEGGDPEKDPNPGRTTGHHLHFEIRTPGENDKVDPAGYVFKIEETESSKTTESEETT